MAALRRTHRIIFWCAFVAALPLLDSAVLCVADKAPVPSGDAQNAALALVKDTFDDEYANAESSEQKIALSQKLLQTAKGTNPGTANHYALLRVAWDVATQAGDAKLAMQITEEIAGAYEVNALGAKVATVKTAGGFVRSSAQRTALAGVALDLVDEAAAGDDYDRAKELVEIALAAARKAQDWQLVKQIVARDKAVKEAAEAHAKVQAALATLESNPTDPAANQAAGEYFCFVKGDWGKGIPMLALGSDTTLKNLAVMELEGAASPDAQIALGDGWWDLAETKKDGARDLLLVRAGYWYQQAQANLRSGLAKARVEKRLEEIAKIGKPIPDSSRGPPPAVAPFDEEQAKGYQLRWSKHLRVPVAETNSIRMKLVLIPPGEFDMGSTQEETDNLLKEAKERRIPQSFIDLYLSEGPQHRVKITQPFYLGMFEVTQAEYQQVMGTNPSRFKTSDPGLPVEQVSWNDAQEFCRRLSELPEEKAAGRVYQLPTEAQWEYACRAGTTSRCYYGNDLAHLGEYAWLPANSRGSTHRVGQKRPNAWALCDMLGNVLEWCADWYGDDYYEHSPQDDPSGPSAGAYRVLRGGSWLRLPDYFWCAYRNRRGPDYVRDCAGFRVTRTLQP